jgi:hypothetical protein
MVRSDTDLAAVTEGLRFAVLDRTTNTLLNRGARCSAQSCGTLQFYKTAYIRYMISNHDWPMVLLQKWQNDDDSRSTWLMICIL